MLGKLEECVKRLKHGIGKVVGTGFSYTEIVANRPQIAWGLICWCEIYVWEKWYRNGNAICKRAGKNGIHRAWLVVFENSLCLMELS